MNSLYSLTFAPVSEMKTSSRVGSLRQIFLMSAPASESISGLIASSPVSVMWKVAPFL